MEKDILNLKKELLNENLEIYYKNLNNLKQTLKDPTSEIYRHPVVSEMIRIEGIKKISELALEEIKAKGESARIGEYLGRLKNLSKEFYLIIINRYVAQGVKEFINYILAVAQAVTKEDLSQQEKRLLGTILPTESMKKYKGMLSKEETKFVADQLVKIEDTNFIDDTGFYSTTINVLPRNHLTNLIKEDDKYFFLLNSTLETKAKRIKDVDPSDISSNKNISTNKKIEIMKNAGINKTEIDKLKPNKEKSKKEKKFGKGIVK